MSKYNWKRVLFSDEKTFYLGAMKTHAYREPGKRKTFPVQRHPPKINVWAGAGAYMKTKLYFFKKNMDTTLYRKVLKARLRENRITFAPDCPSDYLKNANFYRTTLPGIKVLKLLRF